MIQLPPATDSFRRDLDNFFGLHFPPDLADQSWDNVGWLVEAPYPNRSGKIMLTIDLTTGIFEECVKHSIEIIVVYHPIIFRPLKRLNISDPQQCIILRAIAAGMSIYSPHTSIDGACGGVNDLLASVVLNGDSSCQFHQIIEQTGVSPIVPIKTTNPDFLLHVNSTKNLASFGYGRIVELGSPKSLLQICNALKKAFNVPFARICVPDEFTIDTFTVRKAAVCAGSGSSVFAQIPKGEEVNVLICGEMSHHEVLAARSIGRAVILFEHTHTERFFLSIILQPLLEVYFRLQDNPKEIFTSLRDTDPLAVY